MAQHDFPPKVLCDEFVLPTNKEVGASRVLGQDADKPCTYLCGNSLGPISRRSRFLVEQELEAWSTRAVLGHFSHPFGREWVNLPDLCTPLLAEVVGAHEKEVACMSTLTTNLHLMMSTFYKPNKIRYKILCEAKAFPSDQYAFASQVVHHGFDPSIAIIELSPREREFTLREEDILDFISREGPTIALVLFSGVQYYTGQLFPMESITRKAKELGCICGWDLAHAIGNVPLSLHDWDVDFAVWCTYKYLNSGPGGIAGLYVHEKWNNEQPKFAGWWGHDLSSRFAMPQKFSGIPGAQGYQQSNPSVLALATLLGSLSIFHDVGMPSIRFRSQNLTSMLRSVLECSQFYIAPEDVSKRFPSDRRGSKAGEKAFTIITPRDPASRGAQLSLLFLPTGSGLMKKVFDGLTSFGVIGDEREPDVIRLAPAPLYNSVEDCARAAMYLEKVFLEL